jgi:hypothetical protein
MPMKLLRRSAAWSMGVLALALAASPAQADPFWYQLKNKRTNKCVNNQYLVQGLPAPGSGGGYTVNEVTCGTSFAQNWSLTTLVGKPGMKLGNRWAPEVSNMVLQVQDKVPVTVGEHTGFGRSIVTQIWRHGVSSTRVVNGQWAPDSDTTNAEWVLQCSGHISFCTLTNRETGTCLTADSTLRPLMTHAACDGSDRQKFQLLFAW